MLEDLNENSTGEFTETTQESWISRIVSSIKGLIFGILFVGGAVFALFWNEGREVAQTKALNTGAKEVVSIDASTVDPGFEGRFVHLSGMASTEEVLQDKKYKVSVSNALKLKRKVEYYQYKESKKTTSKKKVGGSSTKKTTYSYSKQWVSHPINSSNFKKSEYRDVNSTRVKVDKLISPAKKVTIGGFTLSDDLLAKIQTDKPVNLDEVVAEAPRENKRGKKKRSKNKPSPAYKLVDNSYYYGNSLSAPEIGDVRVSFTYAEASDYSIMAQQSGVSFTPYQTKTNELSLLEKGVLSADLMIAEAKADNKLTSWIFRGVGTLVVFLGFGLLMKPLSVLADVIPLLGNIVGAGTSLIAFLLALCVSISTIAVAWVVYRPLLGIALLVISASILFFRFKASSKQPTATLETAL